MDVNPEILDEKELFALGVNHIIKSLTIQNIQDKLRAFVSYNVTDVPQEILALKIQVRTGQFVYRVVLSIAENLSRCFEGMPKNTVNVYKWTNETFKTLVVKLAENFRLSF